MIAKWHLKAIVQKTISFFPFKEQLNQFFQKNVTKRVFLSDTYFGYKIKHAKDHIDFFKKYGKIGEDKVIIELGTGWYPVVPIFMYLNDVGKVISIDIQTWLSKEKIITTINKMIEWREQGKFAEYFPEINEEKWEKLIAIPGNPVSSLEEINETIGLTTLIRDARNTEMEEGSIDFICSNNTFEHIPEGILEGILAEFNRIAKDGGVMSHFIDLSDHFSHFDKSINEYNFLKFSKKWWNIIDNSIQPQNRLRWKEYQEMYQKLSIPLTEEVIHDGKIENLEKVKVHKEYDRFTKEELAVRSGYIASKIRK